MCGIAGLWNRDHRPVDAERLRALTDRMTHRGPDASGFFEDGDLGLGHRRLSIIDVAHSHQPMHSESGLSIVYNGELYNFRELRSQLEAKGFQFQTSGDTEVILAAYAAWGADCLLRFRGMFAFAIWDRRKRELFLARDRFGIKPLCICRYDEGIAFASEVEAFSALGEGFRKEILPESLDLYLYYGYIPAPVSVFKNVFKVPPGHYCLLRTADSAIEFVRYWSYRFQPDPTLDHENWQEGLAEKISDAVRCHLIADVPVGAFLSGGIDSSVVVASMSRLTTGKVNAYTIGFGDAAYDERAITRQSAKMLPIEYHEQQLELDVLETLDLLVQRYGEPFADSSAVCTYRVTETAARDVKVMLSGDGGDEIFGGYSHYGWMLSEFLKTFSSAMRVRLAASDQLRRVGLLGPRLTPVEAWKGRNAYFGTAVRQELWKSEFASVTTRTDDFLNSRFRPLRATSEASLLDTLQELDINDYLPYNNLHKVDIASMCHGLEVRVPLLDHELAEYAARIPWKQRIQPRSSDRVAESAMHGFVNKMPLRWMAEQTFGRGFFDRKKMGFAMPISSWLASDEFYPVVRDSLIHNDSPLLNYFRREPIEQLLLEHKAQQNKGLQLWSLLFLSKWLKRLST
jgi:asparagine synthase (glutamine-hydrolysing)